jgi:hypothetical protein
MDLRMKKTVIYLNLSIIFLIFFSCSKENISEKLSDKDLIIKMVKKNAGINLPYNITNVYYSHRAILTYIMNLRFDIHKKDLFDMINNNKEYFTTNMFKRDNEIIKTMKYYKYEQSWWNLDTNSNFICVNNHGSRYIENTILRWTLYMCIINNNNESNTIFICWIEE